MSSPNRGSSTKEMMRVNTTSMALQPNAGPKEKPVIDSASRALAVPQVRAVAPNGDEPAGQERLPANEHVRRIPSRASRRSPASRPASVREILSAVHG